MENKMVKNFDDLKSMGAVTKKLKLGAHEIVMRSLGYDEQSAVVASVPDTEQGPNGPVPVKDSRKFDMIQRELLSASIDTIDGVKLSGEEKSELLGSFQTGLVNLLFGQYEQLLASQTEILDDVKKNI